MSEFFRDTSNEEKRQWIPLVRDEYESPVTTFRKMVSKRSDQCSIDKKPFCARCARLDFQERFGAEIKFMEETEGYAQVEKMKIQYPDLESYSGDKQFKLLSITDAMEPINTGTLTRQVKIGIHKNYECKVRKCKHSIFISNEELGSEKVSSVQQSKTSN